MPVEIKMAEPANLAGIFLQGVETAGRLRLEQQRLNQQAGEASARLQQDAQQMAARAKQQEQENAVEQQRIQVAQSYQQQQIALRKRDLDMEEAVNKEKTLGAARQFEAKQQWQTGFSAIDKNPDLSPEQKDAAKTSLVMRLAPSMGIPGTEAASMIREMRPEKPTVPASVTERGDFVQVTQPNGTVALHRKPAAPKAAGADNVKVLLPDSTGPTTMSRAQAQRVIPTLPEQYRTNAVNQSVMPPPTPMSAANPPSFMKPMVDAMQGGGQRVRVRRPDGTVGTIDSSKLEAALKAGYKRLD